MGVRVVCFAHAGAGVSAFRHWRELSGGAVDPQPMLLPGRDGRRREARVTGRAELLGDLRALFDDPPPGPYILYGHSLGGIVAYTVARALHEAGLPLPELLAIGACPPPDAPPGLSGAAGAPDEELLRLLDGFGAAPAGTRAGDLWHRKVFPVLRDDLRLASALRTAALQPSVAGPLPVPLLAVAGAEDPLAGAEALAGWSRWTSGRFVRRTLPGGHFFVRDRELPRLIGRAGRIVRRARVHADAGAHA
ncbi:thioesterase II family protein [Streptomyces sp. NPDC057445]|uniref:thioesterase II family protein n=1 Tax=Streptomyces sp. NPDC057445 TaxID=3346136 RepID=UPI003683D9CC